MEKDCDRLKWDFLLHVLKFLGFHDKWVSWIKECITTVSFSILVNGRPTDQFFPFAGYPSRGPFVSISFHSL